jgi:hypothetical protein
MEARLRRGFGVADLDRDGRGWERKRGTLMRKRDRQKKDSTGRESLVVVMASIEPEGAI